MLGSPAPELRGKQMTGALACTSISSTNGCSGGCPATGTGTGTEPADLVGEALPPMDSVVGVATAVPGGSRGDSRMASMEER